MNSKQLITLVALMGGQASAFWRMECRGTTAQARIDPLVNPGTIGDHAHQIFGSGGFGESADYESLSGSNCTSCIATQDKSAYWTPIPYFKDESTGEYEAVGNVGGMLAYYFLNGEDIKAFPKDFRMIAGETSRRNYSVGTGDYEQPDPDKSLWRSLNQVSQSDLTQRALGFNCLDYTKAAEGSLYRHFLPSKDYIDANCPDGIRFELMFPSCWDGKNLDSDDHMSHVAYPDLVMNGDCPAGFPVRLPGLFYETIWDMASFKNRKGSFIMSNGDPYGFGYHGDFIMGWEENDSFKLQDAVDQCTSTSGRVQDCAPFNLQELDTMQSCKIDLLGQLLKDDVVGPLSSLPGDVKVTWGPGPAGSGDDDDNDSAPSSIPLPTLTYSAGSTASVNGSFVPGNAFKAQQTSSSSVVPMNEAVKGAAVVTPAPSGPPKEIATSTAYETTTLADGTVLVNEVIYEEVIDYVTVETTTTVYVEPTDAPAARRRSAHAHHHRHVHGRAN